MWKFIKSKGGYYGAKDYERITLLGRNNRVVDDPHDVANLFNYQFLDLALDTGRDEEDQYRHYEPNCAISDRSCFLSPVNKDELITILKSFKNKNASGFDSLSSKLLLLYFDCIADPLIHLINDSFSQGVFPSRLKIGIVRPIDKKGAKNDANNY